MQQWDIQVISEGCFPLHISSHSIVTAELFNKDPLYEQVYYIWKHLI